MSRPDVEPHDLKTVQEILSKFVPLHEVYVFGSRASKAKRQTSDLDLVVMSSEPLETLQMADLREAFSDSDLPYKVDLLDWATTSDSFKRNILKNRIKIYPSNDAV